MRPQPLEQALDHRDVQLGRVTARLEVGDELVGEQQPALRRTQPAQDLALEPRRRLAGQGYDGLHVKLHPAGMHAGQRLGSGDQPMSPFLRIGPARRTGFAGQWIVFARFPCTQGGVARIGQAFVQCLHARPVAGCDAQVWTYPQLCAMPLEHERLKPPQDLLHLPGTGPGLFGSERQQHELASPHVVGTRQWHHFPAYLPQQLRLRAPAVASQHTLDLVQQQEAQHRGPGG